MRFSLWRIMCWQNFVRLLHLLHFLALPSKLPLCLLFLLARLPLGSFKRLEGNWNNLWLSLSQRLNRCFCIL